MLGLHVPLKIDEVPIAAGADAVLYAIADVLRHALLCGQPTLHGLLLFSFVADRGVGLIQPQTLVCSFASSASSASARKSCAVRGSTPLMMYTHVSFVSVQPS